MASATGRPIALLNLGSNERAYLERQVRRHRVARLPFFLRGSVARKCAVAALALQESRLIPSVIDVSVPRLAGKKFLARRCRPCKRFDGQPLRGRAPVPIRRRFDLHRRANRRALAQSASQGRGRRRGSPAGELDRRAALARPIPPLCQASPSEPPTSTPGWFGHIRGSAPEKDAGPCRHAPRRTAPDR